MALDRGIPGGILAVMLVIGLLLTCHKRSIADDLGVVMRERCTGCGAQIEFVRNEKTGNVIPAQMVRSVYVLVKPLVGDDELQKLDRPKAERLYVSHFETCPVASDFSKGAR